MKGRRRISFSPQIIYFLCLGIKPIFLFLYYMSLLWLNPKVTAFLLARFVVGLSLLQGTLSTDSSYPVGAFLLNENPGVILSV